MERELSLEDLGNVPNFSVDSLSDFPQLFCMTAVSTSHACGVGSVVMELLQNKGSDWTGKMIEDEIMRQVDIHDFDCISDKTIAPA